MQEIAVTREEKMELMAHWNAVQLIDARANAEKARHAAAMDALWAKIGQRVDDLPLLADANFSNVDPVTFNGPVLRRSIDLVPGNE